MSEAQAKRHPGSGVAACLPHVACAHAGYGVIWG